MFDWLIIYAEKFGREFPLRLFSGKREYDVLQLVMDCCNSGQPYSEPTEAIPEGPPEKIPAEPPKLKKRTTRKSK